MSTNLVVNDVSRTRAISAIVDSQPKRTWIHFLPLVFLILVEIGGMIVLCYKCEHPTEFRSFKAANYHHWRHSKVTFLDSRRFA